MPVRLSTHGDTTLGLSAARGRADAIARVAGLMRRGDWDGISQLVKSHMAVPGATLRALAADMRPRTLASVIRSGNVRSALVKHSTFDRCRQYIDGATGPTPVVSERAAYEDCIVERAAAEGRVDWLRDSKYARGILISAYWVRYACAFTAAEDGQVAVLEWLLANFEYGPGTHDGLTESACAPALRGDFATLECLRRLGRLDLGPRRGAYAVAFRGRSVRLLRWLLEAFEEREWPQLVAEAFASGSSEMVAELRAADSQQFDGVVAFGWLAWRGVFDSETMREHTLISMSPLLLGHYTRRYREEFEKHADYVCSVLARRCRSDMLDLLGREGLLVRRPEALAADIVSSYGYVRVLDNYGAAGDVYSAIREGFEWARQSDERILLAVRWLHRRFGINAMQYLPLAPRPSIVDLDWRPARWPTF